MVGKGSGVGLVVIEHGAVGIHPGDAYLGVLQFGGIATGEFAALAQQVGRQPQIPAHLLAEQVIIDLGHADGGENQGHQGDEPQAQIDFLLHEVVPPSKMAPLKGELARRSRD